MAIKLYTRQKTLAEEILDALIQKGILKKEEAKKIKERHRAKIRAGTIRKHTIRRA